MQPRPRCWLLAASQSRNTAFWHTDGSCLVSQHAAQTSIYVSLDNERMRAAVSDRLAK
jgi:hypothetical protein